MIHELRYEERGPWLLARGEMPMALTIRSLVSGV